MAPFSALAGALLLALVLAHVDLSTCLLLKGFVACSDCNPDHDLSGVEVSVKCSNERRSVSSLTDKQGYFEVEIPTNSSFPSPPSPRCLATLLGGPTQLYALKSSMVSKIAKARASDLYTLTTPLTFFTSCPKNIEQPKRAKTVSNGKSSMDVGASKTLDLLFPGGQFALPPAYFRFMPIIGIP